jgi:hypothetical protein
MTSADCLRQALAGVEVNDAFTDAVLRLRDESQLVFRHRVGERWARALAAGDAAAEATQAARMLALMRLFRLNGKHLDIHFQDGSRWEARFGDPRQK